ncbi:MAG: DUF2892 domain-containing protein [Candidatus Doudnabacteria bacterium]
MVMLMAYEISTADRIYRIVVGVIVIAIGLIMAFSLDMWPGYLVIAIGVIPLATGLLGTCPTYSMIDIKH